MYLGLQVCECLVEFDFSLQFENQRTSNKVTDGITVSNGLQYCDEDDDDYENLDDVDVDVDNNDNDDDKVKDDRCAASAYIIFL
jgi:hypothetical protein